MLTPNVYFPGLVQTDFCTLPVATEHNAHSQNTVSIQELALGLGVFRVFGSLPAQIHRNRKV